MHQNRRVISDPAQIKLFTFAGRALFTLRSRKTENRFTYKVKASKDKKVFFVYVKTDSRFLYFGYIKSGQQRNLLFTKKSKLPRDSQPAVAFQWFLRNIGHEAVEFWHEGRCGHCAKRLTVPESIVSGFGPICLGRKTTKEDVKKIQARQSIESINALIDGRIKMGDPRFVDAVRTAQGDIVEARRRAKFDKTSDEPPADLFEGE